VLVETLNPAQSINQSCCALPPGEYDRIYPVHKISFAYGSSIEQCRLLPNYFGPYYYCYWQQPPNCLSVVSLRYLIL